MSELPFTVHNERKLLSKLIAADEKNNKQGVWFPVSKRDDYFNQLIDKDLITYVPGINDVINDEECVLIQITNDGRHFYEVRHEMLINFMLKSVIVPIVVSIITTLLTLLLKGLLL